MKGTSHEDGAGGGAHGCLPQGIHEISDVSASVGKIAQHAARIPRAIAGRSRRASQNALVGQIEQGRQHRLPFLVAQNTDDGQHGLWQFELSEGIGECGYAGNVVRDVEYPALIVERSDLEAARPFHGGHASLQRRGGRSFSHDGRGNLYGESGVCCLMIADQRSFILLAIQLKSSAAEIKGNSSRLLDPYEPAVCTFGKDTEIPRRFLCGKQRHTWLDDARFLASDFLDCVPQILSVIHRNVGDHRYLGYDDIGRIETATETNFDDAPLDICAGEGKESDGGRRFEKGGFEPLYVWPELMCGGQQMFFTDRLAVDLNPFAKGAEMGRSVETDSFAIGLQNCGERRRDGAFAIRATDVN